MNTNNIFHRFVNIGLTLGLLVPSVISENVTAPSGVYWDNLSVQTADGTFLLHNCRGFVEDGHVCGILGPSGAGKSTTLSVIGGAISPVSGLTVNGEVLYFDSDKQTKEHLRIQGGKVAWLQQKDSFFNMLTVEETLQFAAFLELPGISEAERQKQVVSIMESLGLVKLRNRKIGDSAMHKGLSGGEKRRLSLALELLSSPKIFIGDEPTSGLDSTMSEKVVKLISSSVKERNIPCILSLHQPRSSIFKMLDSIILMAPGGHVVYMGEAKDAISYFNTLGYKCPAETNPAEFLLDLVSIDSEDPREASEDEVRISFLAASFVEKQHAFEKWVIAVQSDEVDVDNVLKHAASRDEETTNSLVLASKRKQTLISHPIKRFGRLLLRSWRQNIRNHRVNIYRLIASGGTAYLFTNIFQSIKKGFFTSKSVADRVALLSFSVINMSMMALMKTIELFAKEKPVVQREQQRKQYSSLEYLLAKSLAEIPLDVVFAAIFTTTLKSLCGIRIGWRALTGTFSLMTISGASLGFAIGALSPTGEVAMTVSIPMLVVLMTVGIINPSGVDQSEPSPAVVEALKQASPIAFAIRAVCLAEYRGMEFQDPNSKQSFFSRGRNLLRDLPKMGALALVQNGDQVLDELGLGDENYRSQMKRLAMLSLANLLLSWIGLRLQALSNESFSRKR
ncbi:ABC transporter ATP-binding protein [Nitzschia inconspicua]|uniref:ABC transporter ATP-binding protein n=1 Tax=Nitzschia inconspicua TaxID=303405 RepID=A0A9K3PYY4_9STRA|nr:ABC transporter ATP-binding protein [Nitzschia inconspicua]